ncbi:unnamed protein product [Meganyctiphanes norvegica]|uniref:DH domain-containing protein n=1 Tax=Meganyctiphanes norvegica TaxID=48144 RepID=A0AAV2PSN4_MEGNR
MEKLKKKIFQRTRHKPELPLESCSNISDDIPGVKVVVTKKLSFDESLEFENDDDGGDDDTETEDEVSDIDPRILRRKNSKDRKPHERLSNKMSDSELLLTRRQRISFDERRSPFNKTASCHSLDASHSYRTLPKGFMRQVSDISYLEVRNSKRSSKNEVYRPVSEEFILNEYEESSRKQAILQRSEENLLEKRDRKITFSNPGGSLGRSFLQKRSIGASTPELARKPSSLTSSSGVSNFGKRIRILLNGTTDSMTDSSNEGTDEEDEDLLPVTPHGTSESSGTVSAGSLTDLPSIAGSVATLFTQDDNRYPTVRLRRKVYSSMWSRVSTKRRSGYDLGAGNKSVSSAVSLPQIYRLSDDDDHDDDDARRTNSLERPKHLNKPNSGRSPGASGGVKQQTELRRRAIYRTQSDDGRSKSLTHINTLGISSDTTTDGEMLLNSDAIDGVNQDHLGVPDLHNSLRRKRLLSTSKVLSDEYVVVVLECHPESIEEYVPAVRGTTLRTCLERLHVDGSLVQVFLEGSRTPLDLDTDINFLGGKILRVRARDESRSPIRSRPTSTAGTGTNRKPSNVRGRWGTTSQEDVLNAENERNHSQGGGTGSQEGSLKVNKQNKHNNRWSIFPTNSKDVKMDLLVQQLDHYSRHGIPQQHSGNISGNIINFQEPHLESSWQELVESPDQLDDRQQQQQLAIWELVTTEATYLHMLKVITDLFLNCLRSLQNATLLNEIEIEKLFSNIQDIYAANVTFWQEHIIKMVEHSRNTRLPLDPSILMEGFYKFDEILQPYTRYCMEQSNCHQYCKERDFENEYFKTYLAWCETQKECNRLRLADILVQPMQRLTKYSLLLKAISKKTTFDDHKILLGEMVCHVDSFVSNVNSALRHRHEQEKLRDIANRIDAYDAVESRDDDLEKVVKKYSDLNLTQPMPGCPEHLSRHILHHGDLKLRDHTGRMEVHVFLFTDILLVTKVTQKKGERVKIIRPPYHVARLIIVDVKDVTALGLVYINEWNVAVAAFTLQCHDQRTYKSWVDQIRRAQEQYRDAKQCKDNLVLDELYGTHLADRTPRIGSLSASRVPSLAHSHSGSMELDQASPNSTGRGIHQMYQQSTEQNDIRGSNIEYRASSASSEDSGSHSAQVQRSQSLETSNNTPTRPDYRTSQSWTKSPNTLTVKAPGSAGQSLPNLNVETNQSLRVPSNSSSSHKLLSSNARGISYPPHSPRTLRRCAPVPQSRNPPLVKSGHILRAPQLQDGVTEQENVPRERTRRMMRNDRNDNRRYHTAGVIDDIKKQDTKDIAIQKSLSLNYGKGAPARSKPLQMSCALEADHQMRTKHRSCESIQSSSGVSSTSSLHSRSMGSELETLELIDDTELEGDLSGSIVDLEVTDCTNLKLSPHISSTYITQDTDITVGSPACQQYVMHTNNTTQQNMDTNEVQGTLKIDVSESSPGISSVQITVSDRVTTSATEAYITDSEQWNSSDSQIRDILLNDVNIESSDV